MNPIWYFSFGIGMDNAGKMQPIRGTCEQARAKMIQLYDKEWCSQYDFAQGRDVASQYRYTMLPLIDADV